MPAEETDAAPEPEPIEEKPMPPEESVPEPATERAESTRPSFGPTTSADADPEPIAFGFDDPDFDYGYYIDQIRRVIRRQWVRPPIGKGIEVIVTFRIGPGGTVSNLAVLRTSGLRSYDLAGVRAVENASPLPPLPRGYEQESLGVTLIIR